MSPLSFDVTAQDIIMHHLARRQDAALRLEIEQTYSRGGCYSILRLDWTTRQSAERDRSFVRWQNAEGLAVYIAPRLWRYLGWHPLHVRGRRLLGLLRRLSLDAGPHFLDMLRDWEHSHPTIGVQAIPAA